jgi:hypothetical protein
MVEDDGGDGVRVMELSGALDPTSRRTKQYKLVATKDIAKADWIPGGNYWGDILTEEQAQKIVSEYKLHLMRSCPHNPAVTSTMVGDRLCKACYANDDNIRIERGEDDFQEEVTDEEMDGNNSDVWEDQCCKTDLTSPLLYRLYATRDIKAGEEIRWSYGRAYWHHHFVESGHHTEEWLTRVYRLDRLAEKLVPNGIAERYFTQQGVRIHKGHEGCDWSTMVTTYGSLNSVGLRFGPKYGDLLVPV